MPGGGLRARPGDSSTEHESPGHRRAPTCHSQATSARHSEVPNASTEQEPSQRGQQQQPPYPHHHSSPRQSCGPRKKAATCSSCSTAAMTCAFVAKSLDGFREDPVASCQLMGRRHEDARSGSEHTGPRTDAGSIILHDPVHGRICPVTHLDRFPSCIDGSARSTGAAHPERERAFAGASYYEQEQRQGRRVARTCAQSFDNCMYYDPICAENTLCDKGDTAKLIRSFRNCAGGESWKSSPRLRRQRVDGRPVHNAGAGKVIHHRDDKLGVDHAQLVVEEEKFYDGCAGLGVWSQRQEGARRVPGPGNPRAVQEALQQMQNSQEEPDKAPSPALLELHKDRHGQPSWKKNLSPLERAHSPGRVELPGAAGNYPRGQRGVGGELKGLLNGGSWAVSYVRELLYGGMPPDARTPSAPSSPGGPTAFREAAPFVLKAPLPHYTRGELRGTACRVGCDAIGGGGSVDNANAANSSSGAGACSVASVGAWSSVADSLKHAAGRHDCRRSSATSSCIEFGGYYGAGPVSPNSRRGSITVRG